jgi:pilus assembly protein CpaB
MRIRNIALVLVAVVVAGMTAMMARGWLIAQRQAMTPLVTEAPNTPATQVLVAKANMKPGTFVQAANLEWIAWPKEGVAPGFAVKGEKKMEDFIGSVARMSITRGEPITEARLAKPGDRGFLAAVLQPGNRAMTVPINATSGNAGFVFPGDRVDLILTAKYGAQTEKSGEKAEQMREFAATVLTAVRVLAIDQKTENPKGETAVGKTATLEVSPKQAETVALALTVGQLSLSLRALAQDMAEAGDTSPDSAESVAFASADSKLIQTAKPKQDQGRSYTLDRELMFMLDGRGQGGKREVTILRGSEEKKINNNN